MIYKGDNTAAFDSTFLTIHINNPDNLVISKADFRCGKILKSFENPTFPLEVNLTEEDTRQLTIQNNCYLAVYDEQGRKRTCEGTITFSAKGCCV